VLAHARYSSLVTLSRLGSSSRRSRPTRPSLRTPRATRSCVGSGSRKEACTRPMSRNSSELEEDVAGPLGLRADCAVNRPVED